MTMRKTILALAAGLLLVACTEKAPERGALIEGNVLGFEQNDKYLAILFEFSGTSGMGIQEDTLRNGHFSFRLDSLGGDHHSISLADISDGRVNFINDGPMLYLEPGTVVRIRGEGKYFGSARVNSPSREQKLQERFLRMVSVKDRNLRQEVDARYDELVKEARSRKDLTEAQMDSLEALADQADAASSEIADRISQQELKALETVEIGRFALNRLHGLALSVSLGRELDREAILRVYDRLSDEQKSSREGKEILAFLQTFEKVEIGSPIPDYGFIDLDGKTRRLSEFQGKWLLLDFWQFSCGPCFMSVPELGEVSREFEGRVTVISISLDADASWRMATEQHGIFWDNWRDPVGNAGVLRAYGTGAIPTFVLVSPDGIVKSVHVGYHAGILREMARSAD